MTPTPEALSPFLWAGRPSTLDLPRLPKRNQRVKDQHGKIMRDNTGSHFSTPLEPSRKHIATGKPRGGGRGRTPVYIDETEIRRMRSLGYSINRVAKELQRDPKTIAARLLLMSGTK